MCDEINYPVLYMSLMYTDTFYFANLLTVLAYRPYIYTGSIGETLYCAPNLKAHELASFMPRIILNDTQTARFNSGQATKRKRKMFNVSQ